jgi:DNA-binding NarL/FixJ family response regulator
LIRVLHCDDSTAYRRLVAVLLEDADDIELAAEAGDADELIQALGEARPDVLLLDLVPGLSAAEIAAAAPGVRVVLHTGRVTDSIDADMRALARASVPKTSDVAVLTRMLLAACRGD